MPDINAGQFNIPEGTTDEEKAKAYSDYFGLPFIRLKGLTIPLDVLSTIPLEVAKTFEIISYGYDESKTPKILKIAVGDASRLQKKAPAILSELKKQKNLNIELAVTTRADLDYALNYYIKQLASSVLPPKESTPSVGPFEPVKPVASAKPYPLIDLKTVLIPDHVLVRFPEEVAIRYNIVVFDAPAENKIKVAAVNPNDPKIADILNFVKERNKIDIELYETSEQSMAWALRSYHNKPKPVPDILKSSVVPVEEKKEKSVEIKPTFSATSTNIKRETPKFVEPEAKSQAEIKNKSGVPEVKAEEIASSELRSDESKDETTVLISAVYEEAEKNLDKILPHGIGSVEELKASVKSGFIPKTLAAIIYFAVSKGASDIHIEADRNTIRLRYRIDGLLRDILKIPLELQAPIISRIKILSKLKIDETRIPQDGRFEVNVKDKEIDLRVSTLPTIHGEKTVLRILDKSSQLLDIKDLGIMGNNLKILENNIRKPYGIILSTGPTGSGKTSTLYSIIIHINKPEINVVTLEDPVEYEIPNVNQSQIKPKIGFGFADGLRSILRQDPNIIMVGEIRDQETASMATHAALTGHLVLTTLHTNDTASALPRLINMGVEPFLITSAINCIMAQRLVRKICPKCKEEYDVPEVVKEGIKKEIYEGKNSEMSEFKNKEPKFYHGRGCSECTDGYKGRIGIFEILQLSDKIEDLAVMRAPANQIKDQAIKEGMLTIKEDGIIKVLKGITTIDEVIRVCSD